MKVSIFCKKIQFSILRMVLCISLFVFSGLVQAIAAGDQCAEVQIKCLDCEYTGTRRQWEKLIQRAAPGAKAKLLESYHRALQSKPPTDMDRSCVAPEDLAVDDRDDRKEEDFLRATRQSNELPDHIQRLAMDRNAFARLLETMGDSELRKCLGLRGMATPLSAGIIIKLRLADLYIQELKRKRDSYDVDADAALARVDKTYRNLVPDVEVAIAYIRSLAQPVASTQAQITDVGTTLIGIIPGGEKVVAVAKSVLTILRIMKAANISDSRVEGVSVDDPSVLVASAARIEYELSVLRSSFIQFHSKTALLAHLAAQNSRSVGFEKGRIRGILKGSEIDCCRMIDLELATRISEIPVLEDSEFDELAEFVESWGE